MVSPLGFDLTSARAKLVTWAFVLAGLLAAHGMTALALIVAARRVTPIDYGQYLASFGLVSLLVVLPNFGLDTWVLSQPIALPATLTRVWQGAIRWRMHLLLFWLALVGGLSLILPSNAFPRLMLLSAAVGVGGDGVAGLGYAHLRRIGRHRVVTGVQSVFALALLLGVLTLPLDSRGMVVFSLSRAGLSAVLAVVVVKLVQQWASPTLGELPFDRAWKNQIPFLLSDFATAVYLRADLTLVSLFLGAAGASIYGPALNIINMSFLVPSALYFLMVPLMVDAWGMSRTAFQRLGMTQLLTQAGTGLGLSLSIWFFAPLLIQGLLGSNYESSILALQWLSPIAFLKSVNFALGAILTTTGRQPQRMRMQLLCAFFNVTANLIVLRPWGITGVAIVYALSECVLLGGYTWAGWFKRPINS